ncbi:MgtC/SapB family protein [Comamonas terrae]|uniref:Protein MgtC n=1 Tax=Comamonas terrae TaxID=673548 RepID=A0ABW5UK09_9BURK|nr:MgtC/SapB family protein [Comamonas terrae]
MNEVLSTVASTIDSEFADVLDIAQMTRNILRLTLAAALGGLLGWQRESQGKEAGLRTHMLVAMGSALFVLVSLQAGIGAPDASRVIQGLTAGVGFLGAGAILKAEKRDTPLHVKGLTTAAGIWLTAAIGVAAGLGEESTAIISTLLALLVLSAVPLLSRRGSRPPPQ